MGMRSICTIVLSRDDAHRMSDVIRFLTAAGFDIDSTDSDTGTINATADQEIVQGLDRCHLFSYVRPWLQYWVCK